MKNDKVKIHHVDDGTTFGYDITEEGKRVWYFIQEDVFGDGTVLCIWNPDNKLRSYQSYKEALIYQAIASENSWFPKSKVYIVRSYSPTDFKNIERVSSKKESYYYAL